jgi:hypothetical protein
MGRTLNLASAGLLQEGGLSSLNMASRGLLSPAIIGAVAITGTDTIACILAEQSVAVWIIYIPGSDTWPIVLASNGEVIIEVKSQNLRLNIPVEWHDPTPQYEMWKPFDTPIVYDD